jgi:hypothetical protein
MNIAHHFYLPHILAKFFSTKRPIFIPYKKNRKVSQDCFVPLACKGTENLEFVLTKGPLMM